MNWNEHTDIVHVLCLHEPVTSYVVLGGVGGVCPPHRFGWLVPPARGYPRGFVAVPAGVTCSPRSALGPLQVEDGEKRQEPPQEVPGQRCGEPEGDGGRVRAGPGPHRPAAPRRPRLTPDVPLQGPHAAAHRHRAQREEAARPVRRHGRPQHRGRAAAISGRDNSTLPPAAAAAAAILGRGGSGRPSWGGRVERRPLPRRGRAERQRQPGRAGSKAEVPGNKVRKWAGSGAVAALRRSQVHRGGDSPGPAAPPSGGRCPRATGAFLLPVAGSGTSGG